MLRSLIGDKAFYRRVLTVALPIILQNMITNLVSLVDNIMIGQLSTGQISAVTISNNNLLFIFNLCLFGGAAGAGIFTTQFYGSQNMEGIRHTFRYKLLICIVLTILGAGVFFVFSDPLINVYLQGDGDPAVAAETLFYGRQYLYIMILGLLPFAVTNAYASTLRECGYPSVPMVAGLMAMGVNMVGNYILIFGKLGLPAMGVAGAAVSTVIARYVEMIIVVVWTHKNPKKNPYIRGLYRSMYIPRDVFLAVSRKGLPLLMNEALWASGMAVLNQCYSVCGLDVVPALSIAITITNLTAVVFRSLGNTVGILMGQMMGAGRPAAEIKDHNRKMTALCVFCGIVFGGFTVLISKWFPSIYNTTDSVRDLATFMIVVWSVFMPLQAYFFPVYFTLRAGGKTMVTFFFDCGTVWTLCIPAVYILCHYTPLTIFAIFIACQLIDLIKAVIGFFLMRSGSWIQNLAAK